MSGCRASRGEVEVVMLLDGRNVKHSKFKPGKVCAPPYQSRPWHFFRFALARSRHTDAPRLDGGLEISRVARALVAKSPGPLFCPLPTRPPTVFGEARCQNTKITRPRAQSLIGIPKEGSGLCLNSCPGTILSSLDASCAPCWTLDYFFQSLTLVVEANNRAALVHSPVLH